MDLKCAHPRLCLSKYTRRRNETEISEPNGNGSRSLVIRRRRLITVRLALIVASTAAHQDLQSHRAPNSDDLEPNGGTMPSGQLDRRGFFQSRAALCASAPGRPRAGRDGPATAVQRLSSLSMSLRIWRATPAASGT